MSKPGGLSKLGPDNAYEGKRSCVCPAPIITRDDGYPRCVRCGHRVTTQRAA